MRDYHQLAAEVLNRLRVPLVSIAHRHQSESDVTGFLVPEELSREQLRF